MEEKLFQEFPPVPTQEWEDAIIKDLKGADYEKKLVWKTQEGFNVRPHYRADNLNDIKYLDSKPGEFPFVRGTKGNNNWFIHHSTCCCDGDYAKANKEAKLLLTKGIESFGFYIDNTKVQTKEDFATLLADINIEKNPVSFIGCCLKTS